MNTRNKILLLFPDGVGIKNYLYTDVFDTSKEELVLFHNFDANTEKEISKITNIKTLLKIPRYSESIMEKFLRELICLLRLKNNATKTQNPTILSNWKKNHSSFKNKIFYKTIEFCAKFSSKYAHIVALENKYQETIRNTSFYKEVKAILKNVEPDVLFCSHQRGVQCATVFAAAKDLGIKTTTVIYSWDNLPKARLALRADQYLVWSTYMKNEMELYYPEIDKNSLVVSGTPQFECYQNQKNIIPKAVFFEKYNMDVNKKIICFSGDDALTSPDDPKYLDDLAFEIAKANLQDKYQILLRRCPVDLSGRYDSVVNKYSDLIKMAPPLWNFNKSNNWTTIYPLREDVKLLVSTAFYCDIVVNVGSTMAFDFGMFNKPCVFINYDQENQVDPNWSVEKIYQLQHFRSMPNTAAVYWWSQKEEIIELLEKSNFNKSMSDWTNTILGDYENASKRIINSINKK
ncbi:hypothetical protein [Flavobacterium sp.]|jgi:hypothetical protein|uniref:hypothetical protein n=1 Tax=Flavobacterium sp. TaxID=239 RepID=UPI002A823B4A|nr:hypothetical protein [Flavobacterium sp.]